MSRAQNFDEAAPAAIVPAEILAALQTATMTTAQIAGHLGVLSTPKVNERIARELQQHGFEERAVRRLYEAFPRMFWLPRGLDEQSALERTFVKPGLPSTMSGMEATTIVANDLPGTARSNHIDEAAAAIAKSDGLDWSEQCGCEQGEADCDSTTCAAAGFEDHDPDMARDVYRRYARAALGAATALSATSPTPAKPADYEITSDGLMRPLDTWQRDNLGTFLRLSLEATNAITEAEVARWTDEQVRQADCWAFSTHLSASDNDDIQVPPRPSFIAYARRFALFNPVTGEPLDSAPASDRQRFNIGDEVSHNAGMIDAESKRRISGVVGYDRNGGVQYRIGLTDGTDRGLAYDGELDPWPAADVQLPIASPRAAGGDA